MKEIIALLTYIFETLKFVIISYHIIGLKAAENKKQYIMFPIWIVLGIVTYVTGDFTIVNNIVLIISLIFLGSLSSMGVTQVYNQVVNNIHNLVFLNRSH